MILKKSFGKPWAKYGHKFVAVNKVLLVHDLNCLFEIACSGFHYLPG